MNETQPPLTPGEARRRLRQASAQCDAELSFAASPWLWIGAAVAAGMAVGMSPKSAGKLARMATRLLP